MRRYPVLERKVGSKLPAKATRTAIVKRKPRPDKKTPQNKLQVALEKAVHMLLVTATPEGDLTFRADIKAAVMNDLSVDVTLWGKKIIVTFYTEDESVRRLLQGYQRELIAHLESKGLKVKEVRVLRAPDPNEAPPVPVGNT